MCTQQLPGICSAQVHSSTGHREWPPVLDIRTLALRVIFPAQAMRLVQRWQVIHSVCGAGVGAFALVARRCLCPPPDGAVVVQVCQAHTGLVLPCGWRRGMAFGDYGRRQCGAVTAPTPARCAVQRRAFVNSAALVSPICFAQARKRRCCSEKQQQL